MVVVVLAMVLAGCGGGGGKKGGGTDAANNPNSEPNVPTTSSGSGVLKSIPDKLKNTTWEGKDRKGVVVKISFTTNDFTYSRDKENFKFSDKYRDYVIEEEVTGTYYSVTSYKGNTEHEWDFATIENGKLEFSFVNEKDEQIMATLVKK